MPRESALWDTVRTNLGPYGDVGRVENALEDGWPDMNFALRFRGKTVEGFVELKKRDAWPTRDGLVTFKHLTVAQVTWTIRRLAVGGRVFLMCRIGDAYTLHHGSDVPAIRAGLGVEEFLNRTLVYDGPGFPTTAMLKALCE